MIIEKIVKCENYSNPDLNVKQRVKNENDAVSLFLLIGLLI